MSSPTRRSRGRGSGAAGLLWPLLAASLWAAGVGYKPVVIVHGLFDSSGDFRNLLRFINQVGLCLVRQLLTSDRRGKQALFV